MTEDISRPPDGLRPGVRLAGYLLEEEIGRGGMAVVYRAYHDRLDRRVALKVLAPELARDDAFRKRFIRESRAAASVDHPHIIPVFDAGDAGGVLYLAMRFVPGGDVRGLLDQASPLPVARACALIAQVASALDAAHARGLVHRDVKPTNMLLDLPAAASGPDHVYLSDFGLAKPAAATTTGLTMTGQFLGTAYYVAPEQIQGNRVDGRADQYSLACASFELLSGAPPFRREQPMALLTAHVTEAPPSLAARRLELPAAVDAVMARALAKDPQDRYPRCLDLAESLLAACGLGPGGSMPAAAAAPGSGTLTRGDPGQGDPGRSPHGPLPHGAGLYTPGPYGTISYDSGPHSPGPHSPGPHSPGPHSPGPHSPGPHSPGPYGPGPAAPRGRPPQPRRGRGVFLAGMLAVLAAAVLTAVALRLHSQNPGAAAGGPGSATASGSAPGSAAPAGAPAGPATTVRAYFAAINRRHYARAWALGGRNTGSTYQAFRNGFQGTARDAVTILSVTGDVVTAQVRARQTDGTVHVYQGAYQVRHGVITQFQVSRVG